ncbi:MAG: hypothetical protein WKF34_04775 [Pyrinomonadaceae bacterium]
MKTLISIMFVAIAFAIAAYGQSPDCSVAGINFACPSKEFQEVRSTDASMRIYRYAKDGNTLFFFITAPSAKFDPARVGKLVLASYPKSKRGVLSWKNVTKPLVMSIKAKYAFDLRSTFGMSRNLLLEMKSFAFKVNGKRFVLGYASDLTEDLATNRRLFKEGKGFSDNASGCNEVVTVLNSVTMEFETKDQYCFFTTMTTVSN